MSRIQPWWIVPVICIHFLCLTAVHVKGHPSSSSLASVDVTPHEDGFHVDVRGLDSATEHKFKLNLRKTRSVFSPNFAFSVLEVDDNGNQVFSDETPDQTTLQTANDHLYEDPSSNAVVTVKKNNKGEYKIHGVIDNVKISHSEDDNSHIVTPTRSGNTNQDGRPSVDYVDLKREIIPSMNPMTRQLGVTTAQPEILILFDYANYQHFRGNSTAIIEYLSVFYRAVNNRYQTISNPKIDVIITDVFCFKSRPTQPFIENHKASTTNNVVTYDMYGVLNSLSMWIVANKPTLGFAKYDIAALISGEEFVSWSGLAYLGGACWTTSDRYYGLSVNVDKGGFWNGVLTVAHELAHNLNAPHDGEQNSASCPWSDGYLMSYQGWGTKNKLFFSRCSQSSMYAFINSESGKCVKKYDSQSRWTLPNVSPGDILDMTAQCRKHLKRNDAVVVMGPNVCFNLQCRVPFPNSGLYSINQPAADNSRCDTGKVCRNGDCVKNV